MRRQRLRQLSGRQRQQARRHRQQQAQLIDGCIQAGLQVLRRRLQLRRRRQEDAWVCSQVAAQRLAAPARSAPQPAHHRRGVGGLSQEQAGGGGEEGGRFAPLQPQVAAQPEPAALQVGWAQGQEAGGLWALPPQRAEDGRRLVLRVGRSTEWLANDGRVQIAQVAHGRGRRLAGTTTRLWRGSSSGGGSATGTQRSTRGSCTCESPSSVRQASSGRRCACASSSSASGVHSSSRAALEMRRRRCCCRRKACTLRACSRWMGGGGLPVRPPPWRRRRLTSETATPCADRYSPAGDVRQAAGAAAVETPLPPRAGRAGRVSNAAAGAGAAASIGVAGGCCYHKAPLVRAAAVT